MESAKKKAKKESTEDKSEPMPDNDERTKPSKAPEAKKPKLDNAKEKTKMEPIEDQSENKHDEKVSEVTKDEAMEVDTVIVAPVEVKVSTPEETPSIENIVKSPGPKSKNP